LGQQLRAGDRVGLFYPSANRDREVFADPVRFDIRRSPNPHLAFGGGGPHFCLGASVARTELQVMIGALLRRFEVIEITGEATWMSAGLLQPLASLSNRCLSGWRRTSGSACRTTASSACGPPLGNPSPPISGSAFS
jgi:cytochrome P450